jgi:RES domain-containing protein
MASTRSGDCLIAVAAVETNATMLPPLTEIRLHDTHRLIPSRYPPIGILDAVAAPEDLELMFALEGWTNDRISAELGLIHAIPKDEWVIGKPQATVIMAAFCHPKPGGGRFNGENRGAWYAAFDLDTAHAEAIYHRTKELVEIGVLETRLEMREYVADFNSSFHDVRGADKALYHDPNSYTESQALARQLLDARSNGVLYRSVRRPGGQCIACFRPKLVTNVRPSAHFEFRWEGRREPIVTRLGPESSREVVRDL